MGSRIEKGRLDGPPDGHMMIDRVATAAQAYSAARRMYVLAQGALSQARAALDVAQNAYCEARRQAACTHHWDSFANGACGLCGAPKEGRVHERDLQTRSEGVA